MSKQSPANREVRLEFQSPSTPRPAITDQPARPSARGVRDGRITKNKAAPSIFLPSPKKSKGDPTIKLDVETKPGRRVLHATIAQYAHEHKFTRHNGTISGDVVRYTKNGYLPIVVLSRINCFGAEQVPGGADGYVYSDSAVLPEVQKYPSFHLFVHTTHGGTNKHDAAIYRGVYSAQITQTLMPSSEILKSTKVVSELEVYNYIILSTAFDRNVRP
ncbi:uncharacterized protein FIBRA_08015 [Fibroporia radiculosa]|uniref:Uncharacterized protein n=1 Tax=Fibroporia radiculosa TaxID=599839 RepID=J4I1X4_9APHY|nr:uncharacterized protein FIBRA_08015 [Fibroporia radiculosa]CCM05782.1 predicted protein [Fibroporia radiculosa]